MAQSLEERVREVEAQIDRCDREIAAMYAQPPVQPAIITTLGILDWEREREMILNEHALLLAAYSEEMSRHRRFAASGGGL